MKNWNRPEVEEIKISATACGWGYGPAYGSGNGGYCQPGGYNEPMKGYSKGQDCGFSYRAPQQGGPDQNNVVGYMAPEPNYMGFFAGNGSNSNVQNFGS